MASGPITSWETDGKTMETVTDFIFLDSKITADVDLGQKLKDACSLKKSYDKPRHILKSRDVTLPTKVHTVKAMVSSSHVWM